MHAEGLTEGPFGLLESLRFTPEGGFFLLEAHLDRLASSAAFFDFPLQRSRMRDELLRLGATLRGPSKVRLTVVADGTPGLEALALDPEPAPARVGLAAAPVDARSPWLYHKTTRREVYDAALASRPECDDVVLWNERGEVTEASRSNLVIERGDGLLTPRVDCGLLPGTFRAHLLATGRIREGVATVEDLRRARRVFLVSSVRLWREVVLAG